MWKDSGKDIGSYPASDGKGCYTDRSRITSEYTEFLWATFRVIVVEALCTIAASWPLVERCDLEGDLTASAGKGQTLADSPPPSLSDQRERGKSQRAPRAQRGKEEEGLGFLGGSAALR
jgi:hypothetical protein